MPQDLTLTDREEMLSLKEQVAKLEKQLKKQTKLTDLVTTELLFTQDKWWPFVHGAVMPSNTARDQADRNRRVLQLVSEVKYEQRG